jgi:ribosomal protein S1
MLPEEQRLREEVKRLLGEAEQTDRDEDKRYGRTKRGDELPAELVRREERLKRIAEAKKALEARARTEAEQKQKEKDSDNKPGSGSAGQRRSHVQPPAEGAA